MVTAPSTAAVRRYLPDLEWETDATAAPPRRSAVGGCPHAQCQTAPASPSRESRKVPSLAHETDSTVDGATAAAAPSSAASAAAASSAAAPSPPSAAASPSGGGASSAAAPSAGASAGASSAKAAAAADFFATGEAGRASARSCSRSGSRS